MFKKIKIGVAVLVLIAIICSVVFFINKNGIMKNGMMFSIIGRNKIGEGGELNSSDAFFSSSNVGNGEAEDTSNWDLERVNIVYDTENVPVPVPKGFVASGATGEHTVNTGFVIYEGDEPVDDSNAWDESCTRNQFVWVPVLDTTRVFEEIGQTGKKKAKLWKYNSTGRSTINNSDTDDRSEPGILSNKSYGNKQMFTRYGMQGYTGEKLYQELSISFDRDMESIKKYGGFYIGRYETGNISSEQPVVTRMNMTISGQAWYAMYPRMKNISTNKNVYTSMIWGCLWDETLQWLIETEAKTQAEVGSDSSNWGNYANSTFSYKKENGSTAIKSSGDGKSIPTGSSEHSIANNIYDLAGNVFDGTLQQDEGRCRNFRGGYFHVSGDEDTVAYRARYIPTNTSSGNGYRTHMCIK